MYKDLNKIFWGIILTLIDINIGWFDILPDFIGYLLIIDGLASLYNKTKQMEFNISIVFFVLMMSLSILFRIYNANIMQDFTARSMILTTLSQIFQILSVFYMYTGIINILNNFDSEELKEYIKLSRRNYVYVFLITTFIMTLSPIMSINNLQYLLFFIGIVDLVVLIKWAYNIRLVRNHYSRELN